jgi:hypothetical protein
MASMIVTFPAVAAHLIGSFSTTWARTILQVRLIWAGGPVADRGVLALPDPGIDPPEVGLPATDRESQAENLGLTRLSCMACHRTEALPPGGLPNFHGASAAA